MDFDTTGAHMGTKDGYAGRFGLRARRASVCGLLMMLALLAAAGCLPFGLGQTQPVEPTQTPIPATSTPTASATPTRVVKPTPTPWPAVTPDAEQIAEQSGALLPEFAQDMEALVSATYYQIDLRVIFAVGDSQAELEGTVRIRYTNTSQSPLTDMALMLWPNDDQYRSEMTAGPVLVGGEEVTAQEELGGLALRLTLPYPLPPGAEIELSLPFHIRAYAPIGGATPQRFGITEGVLVAPTFYPLVPRLLGEYWQVERAAPGGDTTNSDIAFYDVRITLAEDLGLAASGVEVEAKSNGDGTRTVRFVSGPMRDFAFAAGPFDVYERTADGVTVRAWVLGEHANQAETMLRAAARQLELLGELVGPYPYPELDLVDAPGAFGGIEYPGLIFIGTMGTSWLIEPTVHEVAHQWFYGMIGNDQLHEPWLDEAAATYAEVLYYEHFGRAGQDVGLLASFHYQLRFMSDPNLPIGLALASYPSEYDYGVFVYLKGALFFDALRMRMGDQDFFDFLKAYFAQTRYGFASAEVFEQMAEEVCECNLDALFDLWVYQGGEIPGQ
jgi:hypothetical protein